MEQILYYFLLDSHGWTVALLHRLLSTHMRLVHSQYCYSLCSMVVMVVLDYGSLFPLSIFFVVFK